MSRKGTLAENAVGVLDHAIERETGFGKTAKGGAEVAHEHGRGDTLARNIPQHEEQAGIRFEKIAVIAADHAGGLVVVAYVPPH